MKMTFDEFYTLQWGRRLLAAEIRTARNSWPNPATLQWGRRLLAAEMRGAAR